MSKTSLNPKISKVSTTERVEREDLGGNPSKKVKDTFTTDDPKRVAWKKMIKAEEAIPGGILQEMEDIAEGMQPQETPNDPVWAAEKAWLESFMFGDPELIRQAGNGGMDLPEEIRIPDVKKMFYEFKVLHDNPYPLYKELWTLDETINALIESKWEAIRSGDLTPYETEIMIKSIRQLKDKRRFNRMNIEWAYYHVINTTMRIKEQQNSP